MTEISFFGTGVALTFLGADLRGFFFDGRSLEGLFFTELFVLGLFFLVFFFKDVFFLLGFFFLEELFFFFFFLSCCVLAVWAETDSNGRTPANMNRTSKRVIQLNNFTRISGMINLQQRRKTERD